LSAERGVKFASVFLIGLLITSIVLGAILAANHYHTGGTQEIFSYSSKDANGYSSNAYIAQGFNSDGDLIAIEQMGAWGSDEFPYPHYFISISKDGDLNWKAGHNGYCSITEGSDGNYYYADFLNSTDIIDDAKWRWGNLTSLDHEGHYRWSHVEAVGNMDFLGNFPDGTTAACLRFPDNEVSILGLSTGGDKGWTYEVDLGPNSGYQHSKMEANGTLVIQVQENEEDHVLNHYIGLDQKGNEVWRETLRQDDSVTVYFPKSLDGGIYFTLIEEVLDENTSVFYVRAYDLVNETYVWNTTLGRSGNPEGRPVGVRAEVGTVIDIDGTIFVEGRWFPEVDFLNDALYGLDPNGNILWHRHGVGAIVDGYSSGGMLLRDDFELTKVSSDGKTLWQYDLDASDFDWYNFNVMLGSDGTIYVDGNSIMAYDQVSISNSVILIIVLVLIDIAAISVFVWYGHKEKGRGQ
jgi:hypothetical protein